MGQCWKQSTFTEKYEYPFSPQWHSTKRHSGMELWQNQVWSQLKVEQFHMYLLVVSRWKNAEMCKLDSDHHYGARYLSLPKPMGNASRNPSFYTKPRSSPNISTSTIHWNEDSTTHHLVIWIDKCGLKPWPNYPTYATPPMSSIDTSATSMNTKLCIWSAKTTNPLSWKQATL